MWELCKRFLSSISSFTDYGSGIRLPHCSKLAINWRNNNEVTIHRHDIIVKFFDVVLFLLLSLVTDPSFISISSLILELWQFSFIRDWPTIRKLEIPPWVLPKNWRLGWVRDPKFGTNVSNQMLLNAAKCQGHNLYRFWVIKGKPTGG